MLFRSNPRPGTPGHFIFIGTGSHRALVSELTARRNQAFAGATSVPYPVLNGDYVQHLMKRLAQEGAAPLPSLAVAVYAFGRPVVRALIVVWGFVLALVFGVWTPLFQTW